MRLAHGLVPYILLALVTAAMAQLPPNNDVAWQLWIGRELASGADLYRDIIEINPPLWFWLAVPIVQLAAFLGISGSSTLAIFLGLSAAVSIALTVPLLERRVLLPCLMVGAFFLTGVSATGQREQFTLITVAPYVFLIAARADQKDVRVPLATAIGAWAAAGLALKPHFALVPLALEGWLAFRGRFTYRPEFVVVVGIGAAYLFMVLIFIPEYVGDIVPLARATYGEFDSAITLIFSDTVAVSVLVAGGLLLARPQSSAVQALAVAAAAFLICYLLQQKGARYQGLPAIGFFSLAAAIALVEGFREKAAALPLSLALIAVLATSNRQNVEPWAAVMAATEGLQPGTDVVILSPYGNVAWPAVEVRNLDWKSRFMFLWMMPAVLREPQKHQALAMYVRQAVAEDLAEHRPELVLIDRRVAPFLAADPRFRAELNHYNSGPNFSSLLSFRLKHAPS